jgi:hypothetical protein
MKIAIYQGFLFHYEMLGYILEYVIQSKLSFDLYCPEDCYGNEWKEFYQTIFKIKINFINPSKINPYNYDLIFLITDDDKSFKQEWLDDIGESKVVCIDHTSQIRRNPYNMLRLSTRFYYYRPKCLWALPVYNYINKLDKYKYLNQTNRINVACIGLQNIVYSGEFLKQLFYNFDSIDFHVMNRKLDKTYENFSNIKTYENVSTHNLMELLKKTHYILCFENPDYLKPITCSISASVPLAFTSGCQLIIPKSWQHYYNFNSAISYEDTLLQKNKTTTKMFLNGQIDLNKIYSESYELINHKNKTFTDIIETKLDKNKLVYTQTNSIFDKINKNITKKIPNVAIDLTNDIDIIKELTENFREVNCFINENLNLNKIFYHFDKEYFLNNTIFKIYEPCFFVIKSNSNYTHYLSELSKRCYGDIILITEINSEFIEDIKNNIIKNYKKIISLYPFNNTILNNHILIISQK